MEHGFICILPRGRKLFATITGEPFYIYPPHGLRPAGYVVEVGARISAEDKQAVEKWQADPANDCLRARGDIRYQAASQFTAKPIYSF